MFFLLLQDILFFLDTDKEKLLDFEDGPKVLMEITEDHLEKHTKTENNILWVRTSFAHRAHTDHTAPDYRHYIKRTTWFHIIFFTGGQ